MEFGIAKNYSSFLLGIFKLIDLCLVFIAGYFSYYLIFKKIIFFPSNYIFVLGTSTLLIIFLYALFDIYKPLRDKNLLAVFIKLFYAWSVYAFLFFLFVFTTKTSNHFSRLWLGLWCLFGFSSAILLRAAIYTILRKLRQKGFNLRHVIIIGEENLVKTIITSIKREIWTGYNPLSVIITNSEIDKKITLLPQKILENDIDEVWITLPFSQWLLIQQILDVLKHNVITVRLIPELPTSHILNFSATQLFGLIAFDLRRTPMFSSNRLIKAIEDRVLASIILILISPMMIIISILVKISSKGPVFYRQKRVSWNGKEFNMLKFRSMPTNAETTTGAVWAKYGDNRATKIGVWLRKTSLDELPQFLNVLKGDMSIVGPRPERPEFVEKFKHDIPNYMQKHLVKSGITGWAQINGWRGNTCLNTRIQYDLHYIENWSLFFDLRIILLTLIKGFINKNAY